MEDKKTTDIKEIAEISDIRGSAETKEAPEKKEKTVKRSDKQFSPRTKNRIFFFLGVLCCLLAFGAFYKFQKIGRFVTQADYDYLVGLDDAYGKYNVILEMIGEDPLAKTNPAEIDDAKLKELVAEVGDPYAEYFTAEEYEAFEKNYMSDYVGIGVGIADENGEVVIRSVFEGGPAAEAGIVEDDVIVSIDGEKPEDSDATVEMLLGESGDPVTVTVRRGDAELEFKMNRTKIEYDSVYYSELEEDPSIGYIQITSFREDTSKEFKLAVRDLKKSGCTRFIIDLRDNGGGLTDESIAIADYLLPACKIMTEVTKSGTETVHNSKASSADIKYVVLTNGNTASASEILAGAIQDNKGGLIIGEKTYGKGVTQITRRFKDGTAVKLTCTEYFRPSGATVNEEGITPDIEAGDDEIMGIAIEELNK